MGKTDSITKTYMKKPEVFADAFNCFMYGGKQVIRPDDLHEMDTNELSVLFGENGRKYDKQVYRDILKCAAAKKDNNRVYLILGIENQTGINYAMPVRVMLYDALQYAAQTDGVRRIIKNNKDKSELSKDEFVSGFRSENKLIPVITLVVYFGSKPWDGPRSIHQMMDASGELLKKVNDYKLNILEPALMSDREIEKFNSDLKSVFYFIKYSDNKEKLQEIVDSYPEFNSLERMTAEMINEVTDSRMIINEEGEKTDMCTAIKEMREESEAIGMAKGIEQGMAKGIEQGKECIAKAMKEKGMDDDFVAEVTGLSREAVMALA